MTNPISNTSNLPKIWGLTFDSHDQMVRFVQVMSELITKLLEDKLAEEEAKKEVIRKYHLFPK